MEARVRGDDGLQGRSLWKEITLTQTTIKHKLDEDP